LRVQRGTRIIELLVVLDSEVRKRGCRTNDANFGIGTLAAVATAGVGGDDDEKSKPTPCRSHWSCGHGCYRAGDRVGTGANRLSGPGDQDDRAGAGRP